MSQTPLTPEELAAACEVSRETLDRLRAYVALLRRWQKAINLVSAGTLHDPWRRHILDCAQLTAFLPAQARNLVDLGSGAGLPGLVLAILGAPSVHLVEADRRKAAFLREAARVTGTEAIVHGCRIEDLAPLPADVVTARALAPLPRLLALAVPRLAPHGRCLFLKGRMVDDELTTAAADWHMRVTRFTSRSDPDGVVLQLEEIARAPDRQS